MKGYKIADCITILNKLLVPNTTLSNAERQELLNFFVEEKIKSIKIYESTIQQKSQDVLATIKAKKEALVEKKQYDEVARIRDVEKSYEHILQVAEVLSNNDHVAAFQYGSDGLSLIIVEGEYPHTITELGKMGLHLIFFSQTLNKLSL